MLICLAGPERRRLLHRCRYNGSFRNTTDQLKFIRSKFDDPAGCVGEHYVIIHNIDGPMIRSEASQMVQHLRH